jgi:hypothetical protein
MVSLSEDNTMLQQAQEKLQQLSPKRLQVALDFLTYLEEKEEKEATLELLNIPGFEAEFQEAIQQAELREVVSFDSIRRHV